MEKEKQNHNRSIIPSSIETRICTIRGVHVMLDSDLAEIYQVETKVLNQAVKRNLERFPDSFRFQLTDHEIELVANSDQFSNLRSQSVTSSDHGGRRYLPYAFTEQGVAMLSAVLRSGIAIKVSIQIINAFVAMRKTLSHNHGILQRMDGIERKLLETDQKFELVFKALEGGDNIPTQGVFFDGEIFDAYQLISKIIRTAKKSIVLIDNYIDDSVLVHLCKKEKEVKLLILTKNVTKQLQLDVKKANEQYPKIELKEFNKAHDRFLIIDHNEVYHLGASLKDLGKKWFAFSKMDKSSVESVLNSIWGLI